MAVKPNAGTMRGVRAVRDPQGILLDTFEDPIIGKIGYVVVQGEGAPAVFDGENWHSVMDITEEEWTNSLPTLVAEQGQKIVQNANADPTYAQLAAQLVGGVATTPGSFTTSESGQQSSQEPVTYYGA